MKKINYLFALLIIGSFLPIGLIEANMGVGASGEVRISTPGENPINARRLDLQNRLFKEKIEDKKADFQKARDDFKNSTPETRNIMRSEFRVQFVERFNFAIDRLSDFQSRMSSRIEKEQAGGVDVSASKIKLEESISFMAQLRIDTEDLKKLLTERYTEDERLKKKEDIKNLVEKIKSNIKASHKSLIESLVELNKAKSANVNVESSMNINLN